MLATVEAVESRLLGALAPREVLPIVSHLSADMFFLRDR
jgi:hypothetical protein